MVGQVVEIVDFAAWVPLERFPIGLYRCPAAQGIHRVYWKIA